MNQSSFLENINEFNVSGELRVDNSQKSIESFKFDDISIIENKKDDDIEGLIQMVKINNEMNKRETFKNKLKKNINITSAQKKDEMMEKYFNNPENMLMNDSISEKEEESQQEKTINKITQEIQQEFVKNHQKKKLPKYDDKKNKIIERKNLIAIEDNDPSKNVWNNLRAWYKTRRQINGYKKNNFNKKIFSKNHLNKYSIKHR